MELRFNVSYYEQFSSKVGKDTIQLNVKTKYTIIPNNPNIFPAYVFNGNIMVYDDIITILINPNNLDILCSIFSIVVFYL